MKNSRNGSFHKNSPGYSRPKPAFFAAGKGVISTGAPKTKLEQAVTEVDFMLPSKQL